MSVFLRVDVHLLQGLDERDVQRQFHAAFQRYRDGSELLLQLDERVFGRRGGGVMFPLGGNPVWQGGGLLGDAS
jgi:hypothetical protein